MNEEYNQYTRRQLILEIELLKSENKFLKEYISGTKEFKEFNQWVESH